MQPNVQLNVAQLISIDIKSLLMLGCTLRATFFFLNLSRSHTLLKQLSGCLVCAMGAMLLHLSSRMRAVRMPNDGLHPYFSW